MDFNPGDRVLMAQTNIPGRIVGIYAPGIWEIQFEGYTHIFRAYAGEFHSKDDKDEK